MIRIFIISALLLFCSGCQSTYVGAYRITNQPIPEAESLIVESLTRAGKVFNLSRPYKSYDSKPLERYYLGRGVLDPKSKEYRSLRGSGKHLAIEYYTKLNTIIIFSYSSGEKSEFIEELLKWLRSEIPPSIQLELYETSSNPFEFPQDKVFELIRNQAAHTMPSGVAYGSVPASAPL